MPGEIEKRAIVDHEPVQILAAPASLRGSRASRSPSIDGTRKGSQHRAKHVWRAEIVLVSADAVSAPTRSCDEPARRLCVWRWQERFAEDGFDSLLRDKTRPARIKRLDDGLAERVVALTLMDPPLEATHRPGAMMAKETGISVGSVQRLWRAHGLQPHRVRQFKLSNNPKFAAKLRDVVGRL